MNPKDRRNPIRKVLSRVVELLSYLPGADRIKVRRYRIASFRIPAAFNGYRIVQLSDLHGRWFGKEQERLIQAVQSLEPDLILITGDWIDVDYKKKDQACVDTLVRGLLPLAPVYGIIGNHEARAWHKTKMLQSLKRMGVQMLLDESVEIEKDGDRIGLSGFVTSYHTPLQEKPSQYQKLKQEYRQAVQLLPKGVYRIAMGHRPELLSLYEELKLDLVLAGHAHGGLMKLPGGHRLLAPGQGWLPKYTHGAYQKGKTHMLVSCGLGGPRIGIAPEIAQIELKTRHK